MNTSISTTEIAEGRFQKFLAILMPETPITMKSAFYIVIGLHVLAVCGVAVSSMVAKSRARQLAEDRIYILEKAPLVGIDDPEPPRIAHAETRPYERPWSPVPKSTPPARSVRLDPKESKQPGNEIAAKYIVQKGDTFGKIVRKFRVDPKRLKTLNGIKDENKLYAGQQLKLL